MNKPRFSDEEVQESIALLLAHCHDFKEATRLQDHAIQIAQDRSISLVAATRLAMRGFTAENVWLFDIEEAQR